MQYPDKSDLAYWTRREAEERVKASDTSCLVRSVHIELADRYATLVLQAMRSQRRVA